MFSQRGNYFYVWKFVARHCANGSSQIKFIDFDQSHSPVEHAESSRIKISIAALNRLTAMILDVNNTFQNTNVPIHERVCVIIPPNHLEWFERSHPKFPLN